MTENRRAERDPIPGMQWIWAVVIVLIVAGVVTLGWAWKNWEHMEDRAQFGDLLSGVAGAFAFVGLITALILQTMELRAQRKDLRYTQDEIWESRKETKAQTEQFRAQAETMEEQVKVTRLQNALLERQLMLQHQPMPRMFWESVDGGAALVIENEGHGQALVQELRFKGPNWSGPSKETFMMQVASHGSQRPQKVRVEFQDVGRGTLIDALSRVVVLVVMATSKNLGKFSKFSIHVAYAPAQGGERAYLTTTVADVRELGKGA